MARISKLRLHRASYLWTSCTAITLPSNFRSKCTDNSAFASHTTPHQKVLTATLESFSPLNDRKEEDGIVNPVDLDDTCSQNHLGGFSVRMNGIQRSVEKSHT